VRQELLNRALVAYGRALAVADPIRLRFWDDRGLTMTQLRLMYLLLLDDQQTAGDLAEKMRVRKPTITGLTDRLVKQALIERYDDPADRRVVRVGLTGEGRRVLGEIAVASKAYLDEVFGRMGEDIVAELVRLLDEFADSADAVQQHAEDRP